MLRAIGAIVTVGVGYVALMLTAQYLSPSLMALLAVLIGLASVAWAFTPDRKPPP
jgi:hypothetical protein